MKKMWFILLVLFFLGVAAISQEKQETQSQPRTSSEILLDLKNTLQSLKDLNSFQNVALGEKENTIKELKIKNTEILDKLSKSIEEETKANEIIVKQNTQLKLQQKWLVILSSILGLFFALHFAILLIKLKWGVTLPYWLNTIL